MPLTDVPLADGAVAALNGVVRETAPPFSIFDPATGTLRPSHWIPLLHQRRLELHGNWRVYCDKFLSPAVNEVLERLGAAATFESEAALFMRARQSVVRPRWVTDLY